MCRPIVGSQKGRCPSFPPESCLKVKAFGSDVYGERKPLFFSKLKPEVQQRSPRPVSSPFPLRPTLPSRLLPAPPTHIDAPTSHSSLMCRANREVMVRVKKAVNSLNLAKTKAAEQLRERYIFEITWRVRSPCQNITICFCLCLVVPAFNLRLCKECRTNVNKKWLQ